MKSNLNIEQVFIQKNPKSIVGLTLNEWCRDNYYKK